MAAVITDEQDFGGDEPTPPPPSNGHAYGKSKGGRHAAEALRAEERADYERYLATLAEA
jgi:hypothetical protein